MLHRHREILDCDFDGTMVAETVPNSSQADAMDLIHSRWRTGTGSVATTENVFNGTEFGVCREAGTSMTTWSQATLNTIFTNDPGPWYDTYTMSLGPEDPCIVHQGDRNPATGAWAEAPVTDPTILHDHAATRFTSSGDKRIRAVHWNDKSVVPDLHRVVVELDDLATGLPLGPDFEVGGASGVARRLNFPSLAFDVSAGGGFVTAAWQSKNDDPAMTDDRVSTATCTPLANCGAGTWVSDPNQPPDEDEASHPELASHGAFQAMTWMSFATDDWRVRYVERCSPTDPWSDPITLIEAGVVDEQYSTEFGRPHLVVSGLHDRVHVVMVGWDETSAQAATASRVYWLNKAIPCSE